jgi:tripartite-type tricarboxylate transporter receptor subunit TctC
MKEDKTMRATCRIGQLSLLLSVSFFFFAAIGTLQAQDYPTKPINIVIPLGAGGQNDLLVRMLSPLATEYFGQPWVVRIRTGGGGAVGSNEVAQSPADGYTLLSGHANCNSVLPAAEGRGKGPGDLDAVARLSSQYSAYWVQTNAPWKNLKEVIAWAKANPGKLTYGNAGTWSSNDFSWRWLELNAGFTSRNVPYDGGAQCTIALLGGHIQMSRLSSGHAYPQWKAGKIRPIVIAGTKRLPEMPDTPSMLEEGFDMKGLGGVWIGMFAPKGTPRPIINKLADNFKKMLQDKRAIAGIKAMGADFDYAGPEEFEKDWREEYNGYKELAKIFKK